MNYELHAKLSEVTVYQRVSIASRAMRLTEGMCNSRTAVAGTVSEIFATIQ